MESLVTVVHAALFECLTDPKAVYDLFPENFHKNLRELISKIIAENMPLWRTNAINQQVSLPKLIDFDWRVDVKTSSSVISRMSMPTCIIQLQVCFKKTGFAILCLELNSCSALKFLCFVCLGRCDFYRSSWIWLSLFRTALACLCHSVKKAFYILVSLDFKEGRFISKPGVITLITCPLLSSSVIGVRRANH